MQVLTNLLLFNVRNEKVMFCWNICGKLESTVWEVLGVELLVVFGLVVDKLVG